MPRMCEGSSLTAATAPRRSNYEKCCESARRLAVNRSTVGRYLKQFDKEGSLLSQKASASRSSKKCLRVLLTDLYDAVALG